MQSPGGAAAVRDRSDEADGVVGSPEEVPGDELERELMFGRTG